MNLELSEQKQEQWPFAGGEMAEAIRAHAWAETALGPVERWPASLRTSIDLMLGCGFPATLQWGEGLVLFYNDAYISLIGARHPQALGRPIMETFPEIAETYGPMVERVKRGERVILHDIHYRYTRRDQAEDLWFDMSYSPVYDAEGSVAGVLAIGLDTTARVLAERAKDMTEMRWRRVLETEGVGMIFLDHSGTVVDANAVFLGMTGYTREDVDGRKLNWRMMTPPEWVRASENQIRNLTRTGRIGPYEKEYIFKDGSRRHLLFAGRDLGDGTIGEYCIDVSARHAAEMGLRASEQRFRALAEATSDTLFHMNPDWTDIRELSGQDGGAPGRNPEQDWLNRYIHPDDRAAARALIQECIRSKSVFQMEHRVLGENGAVGWRFSRIIPLLNEGGEIVEWFGAASDITVRKVAEASLMRSEKLATLGRLAASIAHEINNPLEAVMNLLYLMRISQGLSEEGRHTVELAEAELKRIAHITRQSLGFYREASAPTRTSVNEILDAAVDLLKGKIRSKRAHLDCRWQPGLAVTAVPGELRQIFSNLLANSLDAIDGEGRLTIRARAATHPKAPGRKGVRVTFADDGKGIPPAIQQNVFDPFYTTKEGTGTGLGLWVTKQILEKHGGEIRLRTRSDGPETWTAFSVFLPERGKERT